MKRVLVIAALAACGNSQGEQDRDRPPAQRSAAAGSATRAPADAGLVDEQSEAMGGGDPAGSAGGARGKAPRGIDANLDACRAAAARVPSLPLAQRTVAVMEGCQPCGEWGPLLAWDVPTADGGPKRAVIERGMLACNAFCDALARQRFFDALESSRGRDTRKPWRLLGELCKAEVSAVPDARFMSAPYFALDRVARMIAAIDPALLGAIELPLPAIMVSGTGFELPTSATVAPEAGPTTLTIDAAQFLLGSLPLARLAPSGVQVAGNYPGAPVEPKDLAAALARPELAGAPVAVLAPRELPADRIYEAVAAAGGHELRLAVARLELRNWILPATVPIALSVRPARGGLHLALDDTAVDAIKAAQAAPRDKIAAAPVTIDLDRRATASSLANLLGALGYFDVKSVVLARNHKP